MSYLNRKSLRPSVAMSTPSIKTPQVGFVVRSIANYSSSAIDDQITLYSSQINNFLSDIYGQYHTDKGWFSSSYDQFTCPYISRC